MSAGGISSSPITLLSSGRNNVHRQLMKTPRTLCAVTGPLCRWGPAATPLGGDFDRVGLHARNETLNGVCARIHRGSRRLDQGGNSGKCQWSRRRSLFALQPAGDHPVKG
jgi:hypothetical protein